MHGGAREPCQSIWLFLRIDGGARKIGPDWPERKELVVGRQSIAGVPSETAGTHRFHKVHYYSYLLYDINRNFFGWEEHPEVYRIA